MYIKLLVEIILSAFFIATADGKELYVSTNGSDSVSYADNSATQPWGSLRKAVQEARAGDTVLVSSGTYHTTSGGGTRNLPMYNPTNSGVSGSPITFRAVGEVILTASSPASGPIIGTYGKQYIIWDGFTLNEAQIPTRSDTGPVVVWESNNIEIRNLRINGITSSWDDNHNAIRLEHSDYVLVSGTYITGTRNVRNNRNGASIMTYYANNITIEGNTFDNLGAGIFIKGVNAGPYVIRNNYFSNVDVDAISFGGIGTASGSFGAEVYNNVIIDSNIGFTFIGYDAYSPANVNIHNNTIVRVNNGIFFKPSTTGYRNITINRNVFSDSSIAINGEDISDISNINFIDNIYYNFGTHNRINYTNRNFSGWQSLGKDTFGSQVANPVLDSEYKSTAFPSIGFNGENSPPPVIEPPISNPSSVEIIR